VTGFVALFHRSGRPVEQATLEEMAPSLRWRGLDGWGWWCEGPVGLAHALLRTTRELEVAGPISNGPFHLAGDVRLDDRASLIASLRGAGSPADSATFDAALVLHAYAVWGENCLDRLAGDFAFVLWDSVRHRLIAVRDQLGVAPLYYVEAGDAVLVGNSLICLLTWPDFSATLDEESVADYLAIGLRRRPGATFHRGIRRIEGGEMLVANTAGVNIRRWWNLDDAPSAVPRRAPGALVDEFRGLFDDAVSDRLRTDRAATHLSGGMDASSVAASLRHLMDGAAKHGLRAYNYRFDTLLQDDEGRLAARIANETDIALEQIAIEPIFDGASATPSHVPPEPVWLPFLTPATEVNRRAAAHGRILFTGMGGDPLFGPQGQARFGPSLARDFAYAMAEGIPRPRFRALFAPDMSRRVSPRPPDTLLDPTFAAAMEIDARRQLWSERARQRGRDGMVDDPVWMNMFDTADMEFTGERLKMRFPFFDLRLIRFLGTVPPWPWLPGKALLRLAMRTRLPREIITRPKVALRDHPRLLQLRHRGIQPWMRELTEVPALAPYIDRGAVLAALDDPARIDRTTLFRLENIWSLGLWLRDRGRMA
jgi:asparagine synthase (glutamine-hydrolysing)